MSIASELEALAINKAAIKQAIIAKSPTVAPTGALAQWPTAISSIAVAKEEQSKTVTPTAAGTTVYPDFGRVLSSVIITGDGDLIPENIKQGVDIFGVVGTYIGSGGGGGDGTCKMYVVDTAAMNIQIGDTTYSDPGSTTYDVTNKTVIFKDLSEDACSISIIYEDGTYRSYGSGDLPLTITPTQSFGVYLTSWDFCLDGDTRILLNNETEKKISELDITDKIISLNPDTMQLEEDELTYCDSNEYKFWAEKDIWIFDDGTEVMTIHPHEFYNVTNQRFMYIADFKIGDRIYKADGKTPKLVGHNNVNGRVRHFTLFTKKFNNYFANGILTGNRYSTPIRVGK